MTAATTPGTLYLVPTPLDFGCDEAIPLTDVLPQATLAHAARLTHWICENAKSCRAYLKRVDALHPLAAPLQAQQITELPHAVHKQGDRAVHWDARPLLAPLLQGHDVGLVSEAGMPAVADPGSAVVRAAHDAGIAVVPLVGPVSILLALAASGLDGQHFTFNGYLPQGANEREQRIRELEARTLRHGATQLFIETPYRNAALWQALVWQLQPATRLARASGLTLAQAQVLCKPVHAWRTAPPAPPPPRVPTVFAIGS